MKRSSVLIVEDESLVAEDLRETLTDFGYDAFAIASSADEAIRYASERCPDVVLMDIRIQGDRDGIETAEILRERFGVAVVFLTAHADDKTLERARRTAPFGYVLKPIRMHEVRAAIEVALHRSELDRRLRERERWFSTTLGSIADAVVTVDLAGNITFMNAAAETLTGAGAEASKGRPAHEVIRLFDGPAERASSPLSEAISQGRPVFVRDVELENMRTGAVRSIDDSAAPVVDGDKLLGAVMVFRDVSEQKAMQKRVEMSDRLASLGTMAAGVAHEVNNPLSAVVSNASIATEELGLLRGALRATGASDVEALEQRITTLEQTVEDMASAGARIKRIVSDLTSFSRPAPTTSLGTDLTEAVGWAVRATAHELRLRASVHTELQAAGNVAGDHVRLGQVFVNLLLNAAQAIEPGHADANRVTILSKDLGPRGVEVLVEDTGAGIPDDVQGRIFDPFFTTKASNQGTGLGLSICHGIITSLGGEISVKSIVGEGSTFTVRLPRLEPAEAARPEPKPTTTPGRAGRVMAIDDEPMLLRAIKRGLRAHEVITFDRAADALRVLESDQAFDVVFCDLMMPEMTGRDLYETVLARDVDLARRIVFVSGGATTARVEQFLLMVPNRCVVKPFTVPELDAIVRDAVAHPL